MLMRPMVARGGRPGLIGMAARTAVVAGTATATANAINRRQARRMQDQADDQAMDEQQATPEAAQTPSDSDDLTTKLGKLADLKASGALSDQEFAAAKAKLLGS